ncbi:NUDIX domain-containing protein [Streptomyces sp. NPDC087440]|uniref:NUDIX domain-containing protein n=1 Tax=Streptomyces sp. NPDC087440 TaxID=3365790 RepID=UPI003807E1DD
MAGAPGTAGAVGRRSIRVSAYGLVVEDDRLLLVRLADDSPVFTPGLWHLPGGGIDPGEQPAEALVREFREETGREVTQATLLDACTYETHRGGIVWGLTALFYEVRLRPGARESVESEGSTDAVEWLPWRDLEEARLSPPTIDAVRLLHRSRTGLAGA